MPEETKIQWCDSTVNPIMGCGGCELFPASREVIATIDYPYAWPGDLTNEEGIAGQHEPTPAQKDFTEHHILRYETLGAAGPYFDPSYGRWYAGEADFETKAVEAYLRDDLKRAKEPAGGADELIKFTPPPAP